jgi:hypothetical protein
VVPGWADTPLQRKSTNDIRDNDFMTDSVDRKDDVASIQGLRLEVFPTLNAKMGAVHLRCN